MRTLATVTITHKALLDIGSTYSEAGSRLKRMKKKPHTNKQESAQKCNKSFLFNSVNWV